MTSSRFAPSANVPVTLDVPAGAPRGPQVVLELMRYFVASAVALAIDVGLYTVCLRLGMWYPAAATVGFSAGALAAYLASVKWVFESRSVRHAGVELGVFVAVGVAGLLLTEVLLTLFIVGLGVGPIAAKLVAAGFVFLFNFAVRKAILFRSRAH